MIPFHRPSITEDEVAAVADVLRSGWLTTGAKCLEFERLFAERLGAEHAISLNSATAGLHLALAAFGIGPDDEVVVPTYTFAACGEVVLYLGAKVVLADVGEDYLLGPTELAEAVTERTKAVMPVHFAGQGTSIAALRSVGEFRIIEDTAHAFPASVDGKPCGTLGDAGAFSFYATKTMTTGEGGMLVTNDGDLAEQIRRLRLHGIDSNAWARYGPGNRWAYSITEAGFKDNLTDIAAAMGIVQLGRLDEMAHKRAGIAAHYDAALRGLVGLPPRRESHSWHLYIIRVDPEQRDRIIEDLAAKGIGASVHVIPLHLHPLYKAMGYAPGQFPVAEKLYRSSISLPIWPDMTDGEVNRVIEAVLEAL